MKKLTETDIKIMMIKKGLKQRDLAEALGVTESYISQIIKGKREAKKYKEKLLKILEEGLPQKKKK